jgi:hypothetical protein
MSNAKQCQAKEVGAKFGTNRDSGDWVLPRVACQYVLDNFYVYTYILNAT